MAKRMSKILPSIISRNQATFVPVQDIHDHILLAYELVKGYNRKGGISRYMVQMDIQKACDSVDWQALRKIMAEVGFPREFINWTMQVVTTISYQFNVNGIVYKSMKLEKGLRQGDPISPLLFVVVMEYLRRKLDELHSLLNLNFHKKCEK